MEAIHTDEAPAAIGPYSQAVRSGRLVFLSGQLGVNPASGRLEGSAVGEQAAQACRNVGALLRTAGADFGNVVKTTCYLADMEDFAAFNAVYSQYFTGKPARSCVAARLPAGALCEIEAVAEVAE